MRNKLINLAILCSTIILTLLVFEIAISKGLGVPSFSELGSRYTVNGIPTHVIGYVEDDDELPFALKPGFSQVVSDQQWHPAEFKVNIDEKGYRNKLGVTNKYDRVVVGDSVAFGFGVSDDQTISQQLSTLQGESVYSLSLPNSGPMMYMQMMHRFTEFSETQKITVLFYEGNDYENLRNSCWNSTTSCKPPMKLKGFRKDISDKPGHPDIYALRSPILRDSSLFYFLYNILADRLTDNLIIEPNQKKDTVDQTEKRSKVIGYLRALESSLCIDKEHQKELVNIREQIEIEHSMSPEQAERLREKLTVIARQNINTACYPIGGQFKNERVNLLSYTHSYGKQYLESFASSTSANSYSSRGFESCNFQCNKDKLSLFVKYLNDFKVSKGVDIRVYSIPAERQVFSQGGESRICKISKKHSIPCHDLRPNLKAHYQNESNNALYLDGSHFTVEGSALIAKWILSIEK